MMRFTILASGSEGNALVVEAGTTRVLVDCGLSSGRELERRLHARGLHCSDLSAIIVTHEHADHTGCAATIARRHQIPVHGSWGTLGAWSDSSRIPRLCPFDSHDAFVIDDLELTPVAVPHDAREPTQFVFSDGDVRLALLTDLGSITPHVVRQVSGCDALILEGNHDVELLQNGRYPPHLKRRIQGAWGHLSNEQAAQLLLEINSSRLQHLVGAHLSQENNKAELVREAFAGALGCHPDWIAIADQTVGLDWRSLI